MNNSFILILQNNVASVTACVSKPTCKTNKAANKVHRQQVSKGILCSSPKKQQWQEKAKFQHSFRIHM